MSIKANNIYLRDETTSPSTWASLYNWDISDLSINNLSNNTIGYALDKANKISPSSQIPEQIVSTTGVIGTSTDYATANHTHQIQSSTITSALGYTPLDANDYVDEKVLNETTTNSTYYLTGTITNTTNTGTQVFRNDVKVDSNGNLDIKGNYTSNGQPILTTATITNALGYTPLDANDYVDEKVLNETTTTTAFYLTGTTNSATNTGTQIFRDDIKIETNGALTIGTRNLNNFDIGAYSLAGGFNAVATKSYSYSYGYNTQALGYFSHAEGDNTTASKYCSHAEGVQTTASGDYSHAEGHTTTASGDYSHAEGGGTTASGNRSHAEGYDTIASEKGSHAEGNSTIASGQYSHAQNISTVAAKRAQTVLGTYNIEDTATETTHPSNFYTDYGKYALILGNGSDNNDRSNAAAIDWNGTYFRYINNIDVKDTHLGLSNSSVLLTEIKDLPSGLQFLDKNNLCIGNLTSRVSSGTYTTVTTMTPAETAVGLWSYIYDNDGNEIESANNYLTVRSKKDGTVDYGIKDSAAFRKAIDLGEPLFTDTLSDFISSTDTFASITEGWFLQWGKVAQLSITYTTQESISVPATGNVTDALYPVGILKVGKRPRGNTCAYYYENGKILHLIQSYNTNKPGYIQLSYVHNYSSNATVIEAGKQYTLTATYILEPDN